MYDLVYYSDNHAPEAIRQCCWQQLPQQPVAVFNGPVPSWANGASIERQRGSKAIFEQILLAIDRCTEDYIFLSNTTVCTRRRISMSGLTTWSTTSTCGIGRRER